LKELRKKMETQRYALTKIAASAYGCRIHRAREVYTKVIRSAIAYGASAYHRPSEGPPRGIVRKMLTEQSQGLRIVAGAYRATPIRQLETETSCPPLDLYLNKRVVDFERRIEANGTAEIVRNASTAIARCIRNRPNRRRRRQTITTAQPEPPPHPEGMKRRMEWVNAWCPQDSNSNDIVCEAWKKRWRAETAAKRPWRYVPPEPADINPLFEFTRAKALDKHKGLIKVESSILTQVRTGKIGLAAFLFQRGAPVATPRCRCGMGEETPAHLVLKCPIAPERHRLAAASPLLTSRDFIAATTEPRRAAVIARWLLHIGRLSSYGVARQLAAEEIEDQWGQRNNCENVAPPQPQTRQRLQQRRPQGQRREGRGRRGRRGE
jgi:hypothetical protein